MIIQSVKEYNREAISRWNQAVKNWNPKTGGFPNLCFYTFSTPQGNHRVRGFVISTVNRQHFCLTRKEVEVYKIKEGL
jgi:hypothetical protein